MRVSLTRIQQYFLNLCFSGQPPLSRSSPPSPLTTKSGVNVISLAPAPCTHIPLRVAGCSRNQLLVENIFSTRSRTGSQNFSLPAPIPLSSTFLPNDFSSLCQLGWSCHKNKCPPSEMLSVYLDHTHPACLVPSLVQKAATAATKPCAFSTPSGVVFWRLALVEVSDVLPWVAAGESHARSCLRGD